jgi:hypothetical protein
VWLPSYETTALRVDPIDPDRQPDEEQLKEIAILLEEVEEPLIF